MRPACSEEEIRVKKPGVPKMTLKIGTKSSIQMN